MKIYNNMSIATINNTIYLAHSCNNAIYQIENNDKSFDSINVVVGNTVTFGDNTNRVIFKGTDALLTKPRNIIKNSQNTELFFIDNDKLIKNVNIAPASAQGKDFKQDFLKSNIQSDHDIFKDIGYTYARGAKNTDLYFVDLHKIYFINFGTNPDEIVKTSANILSDGSNFIGISYDNNNDNNTLYYAYTTSDTLHIKKRITHDLNDLYNFDIDHDCNININNDNSDSLLSNSFVYGFVYINDTIIISGSNFDSNIYYFELFNRDNNTDNYSYLPTITDNSLNIKTLTNYNAIFDDDSITHILGRSKDDGHYYIISIDHEDFIIGNKILLNDDFQIKNTTNSGTPINDNDIIYTNKNYPIQNISILYKSNSNINILKYNYSSFQTTKLDFDKSFNYIQDIAIDNNDTLYIAERDSHTIYTIDLSTEPQYKPQSFLENVSNIQTIHYTNNQLHYITNDSYYFIDIDIDNDNKNTNILSNITKTGPLDSLDLVTDLAIDKENNVGYIAFEERLKWFYPKIN